MYPLGFGPKKSLFSPVVRSSPTTETSFQVPSRRCFGFSSCMRPIFTASLGAKKAPPRRAGCVRARGSLHPPDADHQPETLETLMRAEIEAIVDEIKRSLGLLRRHL